MHHSTIYVLFLYLAPTGLDLVAIFREVNKIAWVNWLRLFLSQTFSCINTPTFLKPSHSSPLPAYEGGTDRVFWNVGI